MPIHLPPLSERIEDILPLAEFFLAKLAEENHKEAMKLSREAKNKLLGYSWPGNVRELANLIERAVVLNNTGTIAVKNWASACAPCAINFKSIKLKKMLNKDRSQLFLIDANDLNLVLFLYPFP